MFLELQAVFDISALTMPGPRFEQLSFPLSGQSHHAALIIIS
jgi:hypothetical protein